MRPPTRLDLTEADPTRHSAEAALAETARGEARPSPDRLGGTTGDDLAVSARVHGAVGDGIADDTKALQSALDEATPRGVGIGVATVVIPPGVYRITRSLQLHRQALKVQGHGIGTLANDGPKPGRGTTIIWDGDPGQPMIRVVDSRWCEIRDLLLAPGGSAVPSEGILFESQVTATIGTNERMRVVRCKIDQLPWGAAVGRFDHCIRIGGRSNGNNDEFSITDCELGRARVAAISVDNTQSVWGEVRGCRMSDSAIGLRTNADMTASNLTFNRNDVDIQTNSSNELVVFGMWSENARRHIVCTGSGGKVLVYGGKLLFDQDRWVDSGAAPSIEHRAFGGGGLLLLSGLWFSNHTGTPHRVKVRGNTSSTTATLAVQHCTGLRLRHLDVRAAGSPPGGGVVVDVRSEGDRKDALLIGNATLERDPGRLAPSAVPGRRLAMVQPAEVALIAARPGSWVAWPELTSRPFVMPAGLVEVAASRLGVLASALDEPTWVGILYSRDRGVTWTAAQAMTPSQVDGPFTTYEALLGAIPIPGDADLVAGDVVQVALGFRTESSTARHTVVVSAEKGVLPVLRAVGR